ncbi:MAG TPA: hypothetical protein VKB88_45640 [Bryobacteraceae bacterium]|nr:hypothetical protein [Bryobacteraceae bacterium]
MVPVAAIDPNTVEIAAGTETPVQIEINQDFIEYSNQLVKLLCLRAQWTKLENAGRDIARQCRDWLSKRLPDADQIIQRISRNDVVEVRIPENAPVEARAFPWEFVIAEITREARRQRKPILVTRHLIRNPGHRLARVAAFPSDSETVRVMLVWSEPGRLAGHFSFDSEIALVTSSFQADAANGGSEAAASNASGRAQVGPPLRNPTLQELQSDLAQGVHVLHFAGIDSWEGSPILDLKAGGDGVFLKGEDDEPRDVSSVELAQTIATNPPSLAGFNCYYSSANTAALAVTNGVEAAIGFQDEIDNGLAEQFFTLFYDEWFATRDVLASYSAAFQGLSANRDRLWGADIVLWSASSLIGGMGRRFRHTPQPYPQLIPARTEEPHTVVAAEIDPCRKLNYSMLHNNRPLFEKFRLKRQSRGEVRGVRIEIELHAGTEKSTYSAAFDLTRLEPVLDINREARVSLTSELARSLQESVFSSIHVRVSWGEHTILENTYRVSLLPTDEWQDDDLNRVWLPSFVLPRDPAVRRLIDSAQRYLTAISDRSEQGFDGYQSCKSDAPEDCGGVDAQVQAIWWALVLDFRLAYINPPPTFTESAQRLRTPTDCLRGKRGTCIDLALLLASAMEYVDLYPVLFLLEGHAFPGYCRSVAAHRRLLNLHLEAPAGGADMHPELLRHKPEIASDWTLDRRFYAEILRMVQEGHVVPMETTLIAGAEGFQRSVEQGIENLQNPTDFQFLVDVSRARERGVTPIPRWRAQ